MTYDDLKAEDFAQMKAVERDLIDWLQVRMIDMNPALGLFTLIRCARVFLRKGDDETQRELLPVIKAYLDGQVSYARGSRALWLPPESTH